MKNLGQMMTGGDRGGREKDDFYATPEECTRALIKAEGDRMPQFIWEPACGNGAISRVLEATGRTVVSSDIVDRKYGYTHTDFLCQASFASPSNSTRSAIITNPPFKLSVQFIKKSFDLGATYVAMLLKATYWHAERRTQLFQDYRPARIYAMNWRPDFRGLKRPAMECIWCVWDGTVKTTEYQILRRPS